MAELRHVDVATGFTAHVEHDDAPGTGVAQVDRALVGRQRNAVRVHDVLDERLRSDVGIDAPQLARDRVGVGIEHGEAEPTGVDASGLVGGEVVPPRDAVDVQDRACLVVTHVDDVTTGTHDAAVAVHREPADAPALRHDGGDPAVRREPVDATAQHVGEQQRPVDVDGRRFREPVPVRENLPFHRVRMLRADAANPGSRRDCR